MENGDFFNGGNPDGKSVKYLLLGPNHAAADHEGLGFSIVQSPTNKVFFGNRILKPGEEALAEFQQKLMVYPLGSEPKSVKFIMGVDKPWSDKPPTVGIRHPQAIGSTRGESDREAPVAIETGRDRNVDRSS